MDVDTRVKATKNLGNEGDDEYVTAGTEGKIVEVNTNPHSIFSYNVLFDTQSGDSGSWPVFSDEVEALRT